MTNEARRQGAAERGATRPNNLRTALWLAGLALFFFVMVIARHAWLK